jgi:hypothetical protein
LPNTITATIQSAAASSDFSRKKTQPQNEADVHIRQRDDAPRHPGQHGAFAGEIADGEAVDVRDAHHDHTQQSDDLTELRGTFPFAWRGNQGTNPLVLSMYSR